MARSVYVGCALKDGPEVFKAFIRELKATLRADGYEIREFLGQTAGTPRDVIRTDLGHAVDADVFLAICDHGSIGLGMEIAERAKFGRRTLLMMHADCHPSRMVMGAPDYYRGVSVHTYRSLADLMRTFRTHARYS